MARVVRRTFGSRTKGRLTEWIGPAAQGYQNVAATGSTVLNNFASLEPLTVMRIRGMVSFRPQTTAADLDIIGAIGMGIVSAEAFAAGAASIPEPFDQGGASIWMMWRSFSFNFKFLDATGVQFNTWSFEVDSKAMRKMGPNEVLVTVADSQAGAYAVSSPLRALVKLS